MDKYNRILITVYLIVLSEQSIQIKTRLDVYKNKYF